MSDAPSFLRATSETGALELSWVPFAAAELHVWILLVDPYGPDTARPSELPAEALLRELIRVPADAGEGRATVFVPVDRALGVLLMPRDAAGEPLSAPPFTVRSGGPVTKVAKDAPVEPKPDGKAIPLVFAKSKSPVPDLGAMAKRLADRFGARPTIEVPRPRDLMRMDLAGDDTKSGDPEKKG